MQAKKKTRVVDKVPALPISTTTWPELRMPKRFPISPVLFHPKGLELSTVRATGKNGLVLKWTYPGSKYAIFEWDEGLIEDGEHYHVMTEAMKNQHLEGGHYKPGDLVPAGWSMYF